MKNILLNNGQLVTIGSNRDLLEVIEENLSYELAKHIEDILWNQEELDEYITDIEKENSELTEEYGKLKNAIEEQWNRDLWNKEYFDYLVGMEVGGL